MFDNQKSFFASRTVWGALVAIAAQLLAFAGYSVPADTQTAIVDIVLQLLGIGGAATALWGRLAATHRIG